MAVKKRERAQVVELLRCAADFYGRHTPTWWFDTVVFVYGGDERIAGPARQACIKVQEEPHFDGERIQATARYGRIATLLLMTTLMFCW